MTDIIPPYTGIKSFLVGNGSLLCISHIGWSSIFNGDGLIPTGNVLLVPSFHKNLLLIQQFSRDHNCIFLMDDVGFVVKAKNTGHTLPHGRSHGGLYHV